MQFNKLDDRYTVSPQIAPEDLPEIAAAGFKTVLCNRPDEEVPVELQSQAIRIATEAAGLAFEELPVRHTELGPALVQEQMAILARCEGPVFAYCASGNRCTIVWALGNAGSREADDLVETAQRAGYDISGLKPHLGG